MLISVAISAKRDQIGLGVITDCATPFYVVNVEIVEAATCLTAPVIARQDFPTQLRIRDGGHSDSRRLLRNGVAH